jgi:hypothetical protein
MKTLIMFNRAAVSLSGAMLFLSMATTSFAQPRSIHESFLAEADYVVIVRAVEQKKRIGYENIPIQVASLDIMSVIKGQIIENNIDVIVQAEAVELSANCCESGKIYLMYLMKHNGEFTLIRGRDGVYLLEKLRWPKKIRR